MRPLSLRQTAALAAAALAVPLVATAAGPAHAADTSSTLTIVGTSDVSDSGLIQYLTPLFEAYEQSRGKDITLSYVPKGTGAAIQYAEAGTASALIVHAASLENTFVSQGYSLEPAGRALTWGDFVLLGPRDGDPANLLGADGEPSHDIVGAYEKVAAAGANGAAQFISRGDTSGTVVQEHAIWALTSGVQTCAVSTGGGGGAAPSTDTAGSPCASPINYPSWYTSTGGVNQATNVETADTCNGYQSTSCYVFTDKGTYQNLKSEGDGSAVSGLRIVADDNDVPGQTNLLVNSFHVYGISPRNFSPDVAAGINTAAATDFLNWSTSPAGQDAIGAYLADDTADGGAPFRPSAAPDLTVAASARTVKAGTPVTFSGTVTNVVPGTPSLSGVTVDLLSRPSSRPDATPTKVASALTRSDGSYVVGYTPTSNSTLTVATPQITKTENASLTPNFVDVLQPTTRLAGNLGVTAAVARLAAIDRPATKAHDAKITARLSPAAPAGATIQVLAHRVGGPAGYRGKGIKTVAKGKTSFNGVATLGKGTWKIEVRYAAAGLQPGTSAPVVVRVG